MIDVKLLKKICEIPGAPGHEQRIRAFIAAQIKDVVDSWHIDALGNLHAFRKGQSDKKLAVAAHLDEISFMVTHIDDDGFIRFHTLGGFDPKTLTAQRVIVHGKKDIMGVMGSKPIHVMTAEERNKAVRLQDFFIDTGLSKEEVHDLVSIGDVITRERELIEMGNCVNTKSLDNRVSVYILVETLRALHGTALPYDLHAVFTVQEEIGIRGAMNAAHQINPDFGIALDITIAFDLPGAQAQEVCTRLGHGAAIKIMDSSAVCDVRMVNYLKSLAQQHHIPWQPEILIGGGTDTAGLQRSGKQGAIAGAISIPTRYVHQVIEMANKNDIQACIDLLKVAILQLDQYDWRFQ